ncbi:hypothetical protein TNCV_5010581 [Trichonephila clavipes]|nr:hypothetical protein TNCV_5010581 [Trichonephila clavipes]
MLEAIWEYYTRYPENSAQMSKELYDPYANPYNVQVERLERIGHIQKCIDLKNTGIELLSDIATPIRDVLNEFLGDIPLEPLNRTWCSGSVAATIARSHTIGHPWGYLKYLVFRDVVTAQTDSVSRLHPACTSVDTTLLRHGHSSIPRPAQTNLGIYGGN